MKSYLLKSYVEKYPEEEAYITNVLFKDGWRDYQVTELLIALDSRIPYLYSALQNNNIELANRIIRSVL